MPTHIPIYQLDYFASYATNSAEVFFLDQHTAHAGPPLDVPYRGDYYKIGICLQGSAELIANLETYAIEPNSLMIITPHTIKQWMSISEDHDSLSVFFTRKFITTNNNVDVSNINFLERADRHVMQLSEADAASLADTLTYLRQKYNTPHPYRDNLLKNLINNLLYEVVSIYDQQSAVLRSTQTRSQLLTAEFKHLVNAHCLAERSVKFYADQLCITPKHLTETVKDVTGQTAGDWIEEAVMLEAKALLQNQTLTISQVSDLLHFADQSTFSRFFKKSIGLSPTAYKQAC
jgi:AraC-like DNA-binding protein